MARHTEEDFARAKSEIAKQPGHSGEVTNYQIALHLERSPGGGLYKQLDEWRAGNRSADTSMPSVTQRGVVATMQQVNDDIWSVTITLPRDFAEPDTVAMRQVYAERDSAYKEKERLAALLAESRSRERVLVNELAALRLSRDFHSAQMQLAANRLSAGLRASRPKRLVETVTE